MHKKCILGVSGQTNSGKDTIADYLVADRGFVRVALADPIKRFCHQVFGFSKEQLWGPSRHRNAVDHRFDKPEAWELAELQLNLHGTQFCRHLLAKEDVAEAVKALSHWFFWMQAQASLGKLEISPRVVLQLLGTEWGREAISENIWIDDLLRTAKTLLREDGSTRCVRYDPLFGVIGTHGSPTILGVVVSDVRFQNEFAAIRKEGGSIIRVVRPETDDEAAGIGIAGHASEATSFDFAEFDFMVRNDSSVAALLKNVDIFINVFFMTHH